MAPIMVDKKQNGIIRQRKAGRKVAIKYLPPMT